MMRIDRMINRYMLKNVRHGPRIADIIYDVTASMNYCHFFKTGLRMEIPASRMSGEMNTSVSNGLINLLVFLFINKRLGNTNVDCVVEGDDLLGKYSGKQIPDSEYTQLGFTAKMQYYHKLSEAPFCSVVFDEYDLVSIPDPLKVILNVGWTRTAYIKSEAKQRKELLRAKGNSLLHSYAGVPIIQSLAKWILRVTEGHKPRKPSDWTHWYIRYRYSDKPVEKSIGKNTRELMERVYGFTTSEQLELEEYFDSLQEVKAINHPILWSKYTNDQKNYNDIYVMDTDTFHPSIRTPMRTSKWKEEIAEKIVRNQPKTTSFRRINLKHTNPLIDM
jgi:hypothetical protein